MSLKLLFFVLLVFCSVWIWWFELEQAQYVASYFISCMFCVSVKLHPQDNHPPSSFSSPTRRVSSVRCFRNNRCSPLSPPCLPARAELMFLHWWSPAGFLFFLITLCARGRRWTRGGGGETPNLNLQTRWHHLPKSTLNPESVHPIYSKLLCSIIAGKALGVLVIFEISPPVFYLLTPAEISAVKEDLWK